MILHIPYALAFISKLFSVSPTAEMLLIGRGRGCIIQKKYTLPKLCYIVSGSAEGVKQWGEEKIEERAGTLARSL